MHNKNKTLINIILYIIIIICIEINIIYIILAYLAQLLHKIIISV